jgi:hypothetical protein
MEQSRYRLLVLTLGSLEAMLYSNNYDYEEAIIYLFYTSYTKAVVNLCIS